MKKLFSFIFIFITFMSINYQIIKAEEHKVICENNKIYINEEEKFLLGINYQNILSSTDLCSYILGSDISYIEHKDEGIILIKNDENINKTIIESGITTVARSSNLTFNRTVCLAEKEARAEKRGVWRTGFLNTECKEEEYAEDKPTVIVTADNEELREQLNIKDTITFQDILRYILIFIVVGAILIIKFIKIKTKKRR